MKVKHAGKYRSDAFAAIHEAAEAFYHVGAINKVTMREFDETCLEVMEEIKPSQIRALREREQVSQPVFARYLNVQKIWCPIGNAARGSRAARRFGF